MYFRVSMLKFLPHLLLQIFFYVINILTHVMAKLLCCKKASDDISEMALYSDWMAEVPEKLQSYPLNQLAIPGSHDSTAFYLNENAPIGPDGSPALRDVCKYIPEARKIVFNWSKTQSLNYQQQLEAGVRYFDLRVSTMPGSDELYLTHGMYSYSVEDMLQSVNQYLDNHSKEVVLLDLNHFYGMMALHHKNCQDLLIKIFDTKLCPFLDMDSVNLKTMWENKLQVIVFYQDPSAKDNYLLWPGSKIPSPWPNVADSATLMKILDKNYQSSRDPSSFYVTQGVLTPDKQTIITHFLSTLKAVLSQKCAPEFVKWLSGKKAGQQGINVCIMDFVELNEYIPTVLKLNESLAQL